MSDTKTCSKCKETKPVTSFSKKSASEDGRQYKCKACEAAYRKANRAKISQQVSEWRHKNKTQFLATMTNGQAYRRGYAACECCTNKELVEMLKTRPEGWHADHIVSAKDGGKHCRFNIQFLTQAEHSAKTSEERKARRK